ncbi:MULTISPECIES: FAD-binding protein [unclassified Bradyrhizobium]|uniref:FAD-binding protein n=1 Tax=unclassified Bradyrhizobium TaxID=2631580 RepID=UPI0024794085|nr:MULTISPECIES: FAD-binding protein [unclassified Bradyrhizobium]WGS17855.1 FAD-binding protein [Bradyrhizobium sp. ISRA463]WGS24656.1 FAD-binding protein [Bradyrhizobium sp. ISRA464]
MQTVKNYDFVVVGCGAAGLSAAVTYAEATAGRAVQIAVLERTKKEARGGATQWTGAFLRINESRKLDADWPDRVRRVSGGRSDFEYCRKLEQETPATLRFIEERGVELVFPEFPFAHTFNGEAGVTPPGLPVGGGAAIVSALFNALEKHANVDILYETEAVRLSVSDAGAVDGLIVRGNDGKLKRIGADAVILASGGFEGNVEMLTRYIGARACDLPLIAPGIASNRGDGLRMALELGADTAGQFDMIHAEPIDTRTSRADAVIYTYTGGIFVNGEADRFYDEGRDTWDNTFEHIGYEIWRNQNQKAFWIADAKTMQIPGVEMGMLSDVPPEKADTIEVLAGKLGLDPARLGKTVATFNAAAVPGKFEPGRLDGRSTTGLTPPKSNWAVPLDTPPFYGIPLTAAICFTYGGVRTDLHARVVTPSGNPIPNLYAAGEVTGLFYHEYPPATSVLRSLTFGRIAGAHAAAQAAESKVAVFA